MITMSKKEFRNLAISNGNETAPMDIRPTNIAYFNGVKYSILVVDENVLLEEIE